MGKKNLFELLKLYEDQLCNRRFKYELSNGKVVNLTFYREQLCHLLGIQHVYGRDKRYLGASGFNKIFSKEITVEGLKKHNKNEYSKIKERIEHFHKIPELLSKGSLIRFYQERVHPRTIIKAEICIYYENQTYILHLFLVKEGLTDNYAPTSFVVKYCNDDLYRQFIENQEFKRVDKRTVEKIS